MFKKILLALGIVVVFFLLLNWQFFRVEIDYYLDRPKIIENDNNLTKSFLVDQLLIKGLNIQAPIIYVASEDEKLFQIGLQKGVVHYPGTAQPGQPGNVYIFGHSSDYPLSKGDYKTVFALLPKINVGEIIEINNSEGLLFQYKVRDKLIIKSDNVEVLAQDLTKKQLTLQTSYPVGTALFRYIVVADLVE